MPSITIPAPVRFVLYVVSALGSLAVTYALTKGYIGTPEVALWAGVVGVINAVSASHMGSRGAAKPVEPVPAPVDAAGNTATP